MQCSYTGWTVQNTKKIPIFQSSTTAKTLRIQFITPAAKNGNFGQYGTAQIFGKNGQFET
jgi:hypothetical protein